MQFEKEVIINKEPVAPELNQPELLKSASASPEQAEFDVEKIKQDYAPAMDLRERQYSQDVERQSEKIDDLSNLKVHNEIVFGYAAKLAKASELSPEERVAALTATIFHDCGKLSSKLLEHHTKGAEYADKMFDEMISQGQKIEDIAITEDIKKKALEAIARHMNHPFMVLQNKNERFPEPQDEVDRVVFDADMLANVGFKNVAFRLTSEKFLIEDLQKLGEGGKNSCVLQESFENVMQGVRTMEGVVLSRPAKEMAGELVKSAEKIFEYLGENSILRKVQELFSVGENFSRESIAQKGGMLLIKKILNEEIRKAGNARSMDSSMVKNFLM